LHNFSVDCAQWIVQRMCMEKLPEIKINSFQLAVLLDEAKKLFYRFVIENLVFCAQCREYAHEGIDVTEVYLTVSPIGAVEVLPEPWQHEEEHVVGYIDIIDSPEFFDYISMQINKMKNG